MPADTFLDTNVLVYAYDRADPEKQRRAQAVIGGMQADRLALSSQVLSEFYVTVTQKLAEPLGRPDAAAAVRALADLHVVPVDAPLVIQATDVQQRWQLSYWDALILAAAATAGCDRLLSEDLGHGSTLGGVRVENPFA